MHELTMKILRKRVKIVVQPGALNHIGKWVLELDTPPVVLVCSDTTVAERYAEPVLESLGAAGLRAALHTFSPGDGSKSLGELDAIYRTLGKLRLGRDGLLLALGGGVVSDLTGFAAATWMRGVRYVTCPTTLEADVDASIGGKTGINHAAGKNMVGAFHHPDLVAVDPTCLQTLPARDVSAGLAESVKHALIRDAEFLAWHERWARAILAVDPEIMAELIARNLRIKAAVVEADEREEGQRAVLNFGHTIGHAVEQWSRYELRHGEAVALGMVAAGNMSRALGLLAQEDADRITDVLRTFKLPLKAPKRLDTDAIVTLTRADKKVRADRRRWILLEAIGGTVIRDDVDEPLVREAIEAINP